MSLWVHEAVARPAQPIWQPLARLDSFPIRDKQTQNKLKNSLPWVLLHLQKGASSLHLKRLGEYPLCTRHCSRHLDTLVNKTDKNPCPQGACVLALFTQMVNNKYNKERLFTQAVNNKYKKKDKLNHLLKGTEKKKALKAMVNKTI